MTTEVRKNDSAGRYELLLDGEVVSLADFRIDGDRVVFPHTETLPAHRGGGFAEQVVRFALDDVRPSGRTVVPACWFVADFIDAHPEYADLLAGDDVAAAGD
jgi:predicted GNAT family acetyltransferase